MNNLFCRPWADVRMTDIMIGGTATTRKRFSRPWATHLLPQQQIQSTETEMDFVEEIYLYSLRRGRKGEKKKTDGPHLLIRAGRPRGRTSSPDRVENFLFSATSRPAPGPTQPPIQWVPGALSPRIKRSGLEADHSHPTSAEINKT
jgi:hypothetical protein